ncbi:MAG: NADH-quinone oxidoreductase subunit NuoE [Deltaproteobacteria bacterium]|nr:NADH-quinone oxidoreductase subunit NuoE [Deltaproteobacteria bacterium]MBW2283642.1 NADH-quinone oxidoreductase subunit NuoE [Deltaproteobacteria bacterium]
MHHAESLYEINDDLTPELMGRVDEVIQRYANRAGALIPVLTECQKIVGYVPVELQEYVAKGLNIPGSTVYGVVTFYSFFSMVPKGRHIIKVCMGTACYVKGIGEVLNRICSEFNMDVGETTEDRRFSLEAVRCLGACGLAPVVVINEDTHGDVSADKIMNILDQYT